ncbi:GNAT family N-acetyltransferase [Sporosarcina thermotolerans]|uniref:GNAT family N-acetyltransferase n=1 Tax=Sporosarcina thermotolerans TaxID=633404 RepID=A0AAW9A757_9BACL|nr:GNAT family N-acetyltransferase [Sporosarcina thermotolerans]MDW0116804.1 GNAT family N-acetyltransferase [Sporosarcina thermotolerans]WHT48977.1 GNAT family N-acetyltransferase [Sporosarcina thermotolerans]
MTIEIREVQQTDYKDLVELMSELGYPTTLEELTKRMELLRKNVDYEALVVVKNNQVIGFAGLCKALAFEFTGIYVRIIAFVVSSKQRKQGIGTMLLKACEEWAIQQGAVAMTLNSGNRDERQTAHIFYTSNGYVGKSTGFSKDII